MSTYADITDFLRTPKGRPLKKEEEKYTKIVDFYLYEIGLPTYIDMYYGLKYEYINPYREFSLITPYSQIPADKVIMTLIVSTVNILCHAVQKKEEVSMCLRCNILNQGQGEAAATS